MSSNHDACFTSLKSPRLVLIGDSDIAYWPKSLYPTYRGQTLPSIVSGHSGAILSEIVPAMELVLKENKSYDLFIIVCAGENDIGEGISLDETLHSLERLVNLIVPQTTSSNNKRNHQLLFLGPKFEPWLEDDAASKKKYAKMSRVFKRFFERHLHSEMLHYIDCLTMFCGSSATIPGAVLGGKAKAEYRYFASDRLHLSDHGYRIWKEAIETTPIFQHFFRRM